MTPSRWETCLLQESYTQMPAWRDKILFPPAVSCRMALEELPANTHTMPFHHLFQIFQTWVFTCPTGQCLICTSCSFFVVASSRLTRLE